MTVKQSIGNLVFYRNPRKMSIPESKKTFSEVKTYGGSAIFQWDATLEGSTVDLEWKWMTESDYTALRAMYLSLDKYIWVANSTYQYNVILQDLEGSYFEAGLDSIPYRENVKLTLNIRSMV